MFDLQNCFFQLFQPSCLEIEAAFVVFRHSVGVAKNEGALALHSQQAHLLLAGETPLAVLLEFFGLVFNDGLFLLNLEGELFFLGRFGCKFDFLFDLSLSN